MAEHANKDEERSTIILSSNFAYDLFAKYMLEQGWTIRIREVNGEDPDQSIEEVWGKDGVPAAVHYIDNQRLWTQYLWIHGRTIWPIMIELIPRFGGPTSAELCEEVAEAENRGDLIVAIVQLAIGWSDAFDANVMDIFKHYAKYDDPGVRIAVVQGLLFNKWPQGLPLLKDLANNDSAADVRDFAHKVYDNVTKANQGQDGDPS
jgi:hypothetical protein